MRIVLPPSPTSPIPASRSSVRPRRPPRGSSAYSCSGSRSVAGTTSRRHSRQLKATKRAVIAVPDNLINDQAANIARFAETRRIPAISGWAEFAEAGNLMSYGPNVRAYYRRVAGYVDKILRGARPADLPVELPTEFELVVNLRAAGALGVTIPRSLLVRAHRTIS